MRLHIKLGWAFFCCLIMACASTSQDKQPETGIDSTKEFLSDNDTIIYKFLPEMPYLKTCESYENIRNCSEKSMLKFIYKHLKYNDTVDEHLTTLIIRFIIEKDGSLSQFKIEENIAHLANLEQFPKWVPGKLEGQAKRFQMVLPVRIHLER